MSVYRPKYTDQKTGEVKQAKVWWYHFVFNGTEYRESTKQANKRVAEQMQSARKTDLARGEVGLKRKVKAPTLREFAPAFEQAIETQCGDKPATVSFYKSKLAFLLKFEPLAMRRLDLIDEAAVDAYTEYRARQVSQRKQLMSPASVNRELATLRRLLRMAMDRKIIGSVPKVKLLSGEHEREFVLNDEQEKLYLAAVTDENLRDLAILMLDTGLRMKEALHLEWPNVHLEPAQGAQLGYLKVAWKTSKGAKSRNISLTDRAAGMLRRRGPAKAGYVFQREGGQSLYQTWVNQQHAATRKLLKMPAEFVPHTFRHTYGTRLGEVGTDAFTIMRLMGHSTVLVSQRYVHPTPETMERAVDAMQKRNSERTGEKVVQDSVKVEKRNASDVQ